MSTISAPWSTVMTAPAGRRGASRGGPAAVARTGRAARRPGPAARWPPARPAGPSPPRPASIAFRSIAAIRALRRSTSSACWSRAAAASSASSAVRRSAPTWACTRARIASAASPSQGTASARVSNHSAWERSAVPWSRMVRASPRIASVSPYMRAVCPAPPVEKPCGQRTVESRSSASSMTAASPGKLSRTNRCPTSVSKSMPGAIATPVRASRSWQKAMVSWLR